ncbi:LytTR family DNA-binding domain-containing protein [Defluviitalea saccharophila]|uniref:Stage 0 sporulation protein A homolog n=1 Tax=Defluviitalea saccharophila TaxID=879970 RepID=A0ABZ2Y3Q3_9FIRM
MLTIAICEDEIFQQQQLEKMIFNMGLKESINLHKFESGEELIQAYEGGERYSIIFLDMRMNELDGIQTAEIIRKWDKTCLIIIITSIMEYAIKGYSIHAYDFILKPVDKEKFSKVFRKAIKEIQVIMNKTYTIQTRDKTIVLRLANIIYIESDKKRVIIHTTEKSYVGNENITKTESILMHDGFIRISRYYLVNINHIKEIGVKTLMLTSGVELNYSDKYRDIIKKEYMKYMMGDMS